MGLQTDCGQLSGEAMLLLGLLVGARLMETSTDDALTLIFTYSSTEHIAEKKQISIRGGVLPSDKRSHRMTGITCGIVHSTRSL